MPKGEVIEPQFKERQMLDITAPDHVIVEWDKDRKVLYVHVDGITSLRICRVGTYKYEEKI